MRFFLFFIFSLFFSCDLSARELSSPTALDIFRYIEQGDQSFLQPASSGRIQSAMFGMVRNGGTRFHEGIDIKSVKKMSNGTPMDLVYSVYPGRVAHISPENNGSYGRYVVLLHNKDGVEFYTLYAHLLSVFPGLKEGSFVSGKTILGMLGQTSTVYSISKNSAHLHFEVGFVLGGAGFDSWFLKNYGAGNLHGLYNGYNLLGADPIDFYSFYLKKRDLSPVKWINNLKKAFTLRYPESSVPDLIKRSPALFAEGDLSNNFYWEIDFTWFGLPLEFRRVAPSFSITEVLNVDESLFSLSEKRAVLVKKENRYFPGKSLKNYLEILFNSSAER